MDIRKRNHNYFNVDTIALSGGAVVVGAVGASKSNIQITDGAINLINNTTRIHVLFNKQHLIIFIM